MSSFPFTDNQNNLDFYHKEEKAIAAWGHTQGLSCVSLADPSSGLAAATRTQKGEGGNPSGSTTGLPQKSSFT